MDEQIINPFILDLRLISKKAENIAGQWNGDSPAGEDRATCARDIVETCKELENLLTELEE